MKRNLTRAATSGVYHFVDGKRVDGSHSRLRGYVSDLSGDVSDLSGYVTGLSGDVSGLRGHVFDLRGDVTGLSGNVTGLRGDVDSCEITDAEREAGVRVKDLVGTAKETP